ncbi:archease [Streptomyces spirodelae]|uniref:Archease n=1 Tax=Streptomyces spirodelae TaxID=2812904 RepID=A0ABS3WXB2_9ACTN|nr:archease [Streptomyces spirodelae]MBO8187741.1 archease [Streptomyces spirodelae]
MPGDADDDKHAPRRRAAQRQRGHRTVPHTADARFEAWGISREECLAEAVLGMVECFADLAGAEPGAVRQVRVTGRRDEDLLAALLEEVIFRLEVHGEVPVRVEVVSPGSTAASSAATGGAAAGTGEVLAVRMAVTDLGSVPVAGAPPKAVSWSELSVAQALEGWSCAVTVDV